MPDRVKKLYLEGRIDETGLDRAVTFKWITVEQKQEIINSKVVEVVEPVVETQTVNTETTGV